MVNLDPQSFARHTRPQRLMLHVRRLAPVTCRMVTRIHGHHVGVPKIPEDLGSLETQRPWYPTSRGSCAVPLLCCFTHVACRRPHQVCRDETLIRSHENISYPRRLIQRNLETIEKDIQSQARSNRKTLSSKLRAQSASSVGMLGLCSAMLLGSRKSLKRLLYILLAHISAMW